MKSANEALKLVQVGPRTEQIAQAQVALTEVEQQLALMKKGPARKRLSRRAGGLSRHQAACDFARTQVSHTLLCTIFRMVLSENVEVENMCIPWHTGDHSGRSGNTWLRAYIAESDLGKVKYGQKVHITTDSHPGTFIRGTYLSYSV